MEIKMYDELPEAAKAIRTSVFMEEQGFKNEFDATDHNATHIVIWENDKPVATCRFFYSDAKSCFAIGRLAVLKEYRGKHYGAILIDNAEREIRNQGGLHVGLSAQCKASDFYKKQGYQIHGEPHPVEGCPHVWMCKDL
ncbi:MAG: GNAT family N-acetyltransferase [Lachnospiraceae bacterium]|nr:GNAT family N-acetyltransferase [Lachnospiraceae bacterium]